MAGSTSLKVEVDFQTGWLSQHGQESAISLDDLRRRVTSGACVTRTFGRTTRQAKVSAPPAASFHGTQGISFNHAAGLLVQPSMS